MARTFDQLLTEANNRLKVGRVGLAIYLSPGGQKLRLRGTFPPKPESSKVTAHQQWYPLGIYANPAGVKAAEAKAKEIGGLLAAGRFTWQQKQKVVLEESEGKKLAGAWISEFAEYWFGRRGRTLKTESTWAVDYQHVFRLLDPEQELTAEVIRSVILSTQANTRNRKRICSSLRILADFAKIHLPFKISDYVGSYTLRSHEPQEILSDGQIQEIWQSIPPPWQWAYGMMATYGLRPHEVYHLDLVTFLSGGETVRVGEETKTGWREVWPLYPQWIEKFNLREVPSLMVGKAEGRKNKNLGGAISRAIRAAGVPHKPYMLRHAYAVRGALVFNLPDTLVSRWMGHSLTVHERVYQHWISARHSQEVFESRMRMGAAPPP